MHYYYLIAGLTEYPFDIESVAAGNGVRVDVPQVKAQIIDELTPADRRAVELLYTYYDIRNIVGYVRGTRLPFNELGNLSREEVAFLVDRQAADATAAGEAEEEVTERLERLAVPREVRQAVDRFKGYGEMQDGELVPLSAEDLERELLTGFYRACGANGFSVAGAMIGGAAVPEYLRRWAEYDRTVRNIVAAYRARQLGVATELREGMIVEADAEVREALVGGQAADFGMKDRFPYTEELLQVLETADFVERERKMDLLRAEMADDLAEQDYFGIGRVMNYLIRLNILHRWAALDPAQGRESFRKLVADLADPDRIATSVGEASASAGSQLH